MAKTNNKAAYGASAALTEGIHSLATSSGLVAGWSTAEVDNDSGDSVRFLDDWLSGEITVGTTPTAGTVIEIWIIPKRADGAYHDTFDGTSKAVTVTSRTMLAAYGHLLKAIDVDVTTSDRGYEFSGSVKRACEGVMPAKYQVFVVHNTGVNLNSTSGNQEIIRKGVYSTSGGT